MRIGTGLWISSNVIDDEKLNQKVLEGMIESFGYQAEIARDGTEALIKLKLDIELVLLDVMMPQLDGFEVVRRIREDPAYSDLPRQSNS